MLYELDSNSIPVEKKEQKLEKGKKNISINEQTKEIS
jgi:hypothetical protein